MTRPEICPFGPGVVSNTSIRYGAPVVAMVLDARGNRFISLANGNIARLQSDAANLPFITNALQGGTIFAGTPFSFSILAGGYGPLGYSWYYQGDALAAPSLLSAGPSSTLTLNNPTASQSGLYSVVVANAGGSVTSAPVSLHVKAVELFLGSQMLTNGTGQMLFNDPAAGTRPAGYYRALLIQ